MYTPSAFKVDDVPTLHQFMTNYSFATLVTAGAEPFVTHLPLLLDVGTDGAATLLGHFAKPNPHWQLDHTHNPTVAIFHGPHAYISPGWYRSGNPAVPTWNYATVHAWGSLSLITDEREVERLLVRMVEAYDPDPAGWKQSTQREYLTNMVASVVAFRMPIDRLEGKFKLGQNRVAADQVGAIESLEAGADPDGVALATFAREHLRHVK